jgi:Flp pilus assembly protein TadB
MDDILAQDNANEDYGQLLKRHLREISFFMHERLVHLLVLFLFAIATVIVFLVAVVDFQLSLLILFVALLVLLIPYIRHYFLLENGVQKMYYQYDIIYSRLYPDAKAPVFDKKPGYVR